MGLIKKIFGGTGEAKASSPPQDFQDSGPDADRQKVRNAPRRELIHTVLRETMRKHGIPSDWIGCRVLSVVTKQQKAGVHVQFIVRKGDQQLIAYVHQFQEAFWRELEHLDPFARQWVFSVAWQFDGRAPSSVTTAAPVLATEPAAPREKPVFAEIAPQPDAPETQPEAGDTLPAEEDAVDLESDLAALYAAMSAPAALGSDVTPSKPRDHKSSGS
jgi:hypothetical protein